MLEQRKEGLLREVKISWRLKSIATWIAKGDKNTKLLHNYVNNRRVVNHIWDFFHWMIQGLWSIMTIYLKNVSLFFRVCS